ncbi:hypothetical protein, variant 3 [Phytophthora nicotianae]|uniref:DNA-binding protein n=3 Tax=Phytophthora nicotianae TaxID=4792 RepID=V9FPB5_PHYNI|nr:hypothetical protein, variant 4 [Phytophthora nicotianae INRA-310]XP_008900902.1 hypothetical protein, variant 3 [Phytophthora nicotianae INRA-310]ETI53334.1 hypothetical protein, variant 3 [Phytophthora nicotianae P1569]ETK93183.1 hypothetical protein, variant 3 [Phytophthora nicotianae]ETI53335.1 hypothetical protein, variant 4 [Phytophthora nicotianae P1569]ETM52886.1 hypothetical protein, variant 3 [Phytophthora nicotianae]ETM52887.1 hypothetical protein, variant 4 [Phytophthora nicoti
MQLNVYHKLNSNCCGVSHYTVARIAIVKPEKARAIEDMVIQMAQRGQLAAKIDEDKLIDLLNQVGVTEEKQRTKVTMKRRTYFSDEDNDDDDDDF